MENIRNFCIIAHINHGKSTLAACILELTGVIHVQGTEDIMNSMELERERGITIKAKAVRIPYKSKDGKDYNLNLIDTPGHVDFNYEVSRSLKACEGAILLVDATQGVEAQTIANAYLAINDGLEIIPVINKIDLPNAQIDECKSQLNEMLGLPAKDVLLVSAKTGEGVPELLEAVTRRIPSPKQDVDAPLQALIFDSYFDSYRGVIPHIRTFSGKMAPHDKILVKSTGKTYEVDEVGYFTLNLTPSSELTAGEVGYVGAIMREVGDIRVGDTIVSAAHPETPAILGFRHPQPMVFCGLYPVSTNEYNKLSEALNKLQLNDSSLVFERESSSALGHGYRAGFLGMLHMEITIERLKREYGQELIATMPSVVYKVITHQGEELMIDNPSKFPAPQYIDRIEEPIIKTDIILPSDYIGPVMELSERHRGTFKNMQHPDPKRAVITYEFPLAEIITLYYDKLKSVSRGYASMDYEFVGYHPADLVKVDIMVKGDIVDALSYVSIRENAAPKARVLIHKLRKVIPRQLFEIPLQAAINGRIIAREDIVPLRKDVLAKCYGGDVTRKRKLLEKQKEGKKKMKMIGQVEVPQEAFLTLLKMEEE